MASRNSWSDPILLSAIEQAFDATWLVLRAHETCPDKAQIAELSMALSHKLVELASNGVTEPEQLRRLALESLSGSHRAQVSKKGPGVVQSEETP